MWVQVRRLALEDVQSAVAWYAERDEDVAKDFLGEVAQVITRITERPEQFPVVHREVRPVRC
jgi:plasmid stabilization system protein ParE